MTVMDTAYDGNPNNLDSYLRYNRESVRAFSLANAGADPIAPGDCFAVLQPFALTMAVGIDTLVPVVRQTFFYNAPAIYPGTLAQWWPPGYLARRRAAGFISAPGAWIDLLATYPFAFMGQVVPMLGYDTSDRNVAVASAAYLQTYGQKANFPTSYGPQQPFPG